MTDCTDLTTKHLPNGGLVEFQKYPKIPRVKNTSVVITEKIDGTNAQLVIPENPDEPVLVGSRNRWIVPCDAEHHNTDNYGFAAWVKENEALLRRLGPGRHFGEWWGRGIARGYGLEERRWSLFNYDRDFPEGLPSNVARVPVLVRRQLDLFNSFESEALSVFATKLQTEGSVAAPGFMNPEGVVINIGGKLYKYIFDKQGTSPEETSD